MRALLSALTLCATSALACGPDTDCPVADGSYRIRMPDGTPRGAIVFAHGYRGNAAGTMASGGLERMAAENGLALIALDSSGIDWDIPNHPGGRETRNEAAYVTAVRDDAARRFGLDPARMVLSGFSAGGMLTWQMACDIPDAFPAFIPISGTFWDPVPESCAAGSATIHHLHGTSDEVVPVGGRPIGDTAQGDVMAALEMWRAKGFDSAAEVTVADLDCEAWTDGADVLSYCTHPGGHGFEAEWLAELWGRTFPE